MTEGLAAIEEAIERSERTEERWSMAELLRVKGELLLLQGAPNAAAAAEEQFLAALDWARRRELLSWGLRGATSLARLWHRQRRTSQARKLLASVYGRFRGLRNRRSDCGEGGSPSAAKSRPHAVVEGMMHGAVIW